MTKEFIIEISTDSEVELELVWWKLLELKTEIFSKHNLEIEVKDNDK